jgi:hypothetical protein
MRRTALLLVVAALFLLTSVTLAQSGGGYDLTWNTVDGGGATFSSGGGYTLGGTAGQPDAGTLSGGGYALAGGFWVSAVSQPGPSKVYLPIIFKNKS